MNSAGCNSNLQGVHRKYVIDTKIARQVLVKLKTIDNRLGPKLVLSKVSLDLYFGTKTERWTEV